MKMGEKDVSIIFEKLDDILDRLARVETKHDLAASEITALRAQVTVLSVKGCAAGEDHSRRITKLEERPERTMAVVAVAVSVLTGVAGLLAWIRGNS